MIDQRAAYQSGSGESIVREIRPQLLWIGNAADARDFRTIHARGIAAIVQLAYEEPCIEAPRDLIVHRIPLVDGGCNDPALLSLAVDVLTALIGRRIPTLVTCSHGLSRSPCIVATALASAEQRSPRTVLEEIVAGVPADISPPLWSQTHHIVTAERRHP